MRSNFRTEGEEEEFDFPEKMIYLTFISKSRYDTKEISQADFINKNSHHTM